MLAQRVFAQLAAQQAAKGCGGNTDDKISYIKLRLPEATVPKQSASAEPAEERNKAGLRYGQSAFPQPASTGDSLPVDAGIAGFTAPQAIVRNAAKAHVKAT